MNGLGHGGSLRSKLLYFGKVLSFGRIQKLGKRVEPESSNRIVAFRITDHYLAVFAVAGGDGI